MEPKFIEIVDLLQPGRKIAYYDRGAKDAPVIFCAHALSRNARDFDFIAEELAKDFRVIAFDFVGRGQSTFLNDKIRYEYATYTSDVIQLAEMLGISKVTWIGSSMGGLVGMTLMGMVPNFIEKLVLNDVGAHIPIESLQRIAKYVDILPEFTSIESLENHLKMVLKPFCIENPDHWRHLAKNSFRVLDNGKITLAYDGGIGANFAQFLNITTDVEMWSLWESFEVPTLVIKGSDSDILTHEAYNRMLSKPKVSGIEVSGVGHLPPLMAEYQIKPVVDWIKNPRDINIKI
ncbi:MAG: alpha/beta hydrolase [Alphaproteobacteria bacterium]|nr:alpha/beta hydrolase [Alphaproteobacteria bacterium]OJV15075.1 MAG: hypothetical protein BGO27_06525 [Alphaproteobacteria bacterium 33-17]